jgi:hypothetical protein
VSGQSASFINYLSVASSVPAILVLIFFGAASDSVSFGNISVALTLQFGRKKPLFISTFGTALGYSGTALVAFFDLNLNYLFLSNVVGGVCGGFSLFLMALFAASVALCTTDETQFTQSG